MLKAFFSIKCHNAYGNIGVGACLLALGVLLGFGREGSAPLLCAILLLILSGVSLLACVSRKHEKIDEMAMADGGSAASFALKTTLIVLGIACCFGIATGIEVSLGAIACLTIGLAMTLYGISFAWLERG